MTHTDMNGGVWGMALAMQSSWLQSMQYGLICTCGSLTSVSDASYLLL